MQRQTFVPFFCQAGSVWVGQQAQLVALLQEHVQAVAATKQTQIRAAVLTQLLNRFFSGCHRMRCRVIFVDKTLIKRLGTTYLHLWSALSSSGVSLSRYWNAIFTSSMKSWKKKWQFYRFDPSLLIFTRRFACQGCWSLPHLTVHTHTYRQSTVANETKLHFSRLWKARAPAENLQRTYRGKGRMCKLHTERPKLELNPQPSAVMRPILFYSFKQ